jgi:hypothetical protein
VKVSTVSDNCWLSAAASARCNSIRANVGFLMDPDFITFRDTLSNDVVSRSLITCKIFLRVRARRKCWLQCKTREGGRPPGDISKHLQLQQIANSFR